MRATLKAHEWMANDLCSMLYCSPVQTCAVTRATDDRPDKFRIRLAFFSFDHASCEKLHVVTLARGSSESLHEGALT